MKLFFLIENIHHSAGTERIAIDVVNALYKATRWDIYIFVLSKNIKPYYQVETGITITSLPGTLKTLLPAIYSLRKVIKKEKPNYIINVAAPMSRISIPATLGLQSKIITWEHFNLFAGSKLGYFWRLCSALLSNKTVVLTHRDKNSYQKWIQKKITTIYNFPTPISGKQSDLSSHTAISVGRLTAQKGFDRLLQVWRIVHQHNKEWKLIIVGNGEDEVKLKRQAQDLKLNDCVTFIPATSHIADYYQKASLYIMTSRFEGLPLVLIEAKQQGLPCVSFNCPNGPSEIIRSGIDGEIIPDGDINAMSATILSFINDHNRLKKYGIEAHKDVEERFSKEKIIKDWINLFTTIK